MWKILTLHKCKDNYPHQVISTDSMFWFLRQAVCFHCWCVHNDFILSEYTLLTKTFCDNIVCVVCSLSCTILTLQSTHGLLNFTKLFQHICRNDISDNVTRSDLKKGLVKTLEETCVTQSSWSVPRTCVFMIYQQSVWKRFLFVKNMAVCGRGVAAVITWV